MRTEVIQVSSAEQVKDAASRGAEALRAGKLVGFATETVYGVGAMATDSGAMERLRELKSRPARPFSVHIGLPSDAGRYVREIPPDARRLIKKAWPGPVTLVLPVGEEFADERLRDATLYQRLCYEHTIGLRCPDEPVAQAMLSAVEWPVVAPSANLAGEPSPRNAQDVLASLDGRIDLLLDCGPTRYGADSTIVKFQDNRWQVVREGVYDERTIRGLIKRVILVVCTGNTCRSPMAAGLARKLLAARLGCEADELDQRGVEVVSAGVAAPRGAKASPEAVKAANERSADISEHRSRMLTPELINAADLVLCMTDSHAEHVRRIAPGCNGKIERLDEQADIPDPVGAGTEIYRRTAELIEAALKDRLDRGQL